MSLFHVAEITLLPACRPSADVRGLANSILISTITTPQPSEFSIGHLLTLKRRSGLPVHPPLFASLMNGRRVNKQGFPA